MNEKIISSPINEKKQIKNKFSKEEDEYLKYLVGIFGLNAWKIISLHLKSRSSRQCKERWFTYLDNKINLSEWKKEEDENLIKYVKIYGRHWKKIKSFFFDRTETNIKNRWAVLTRKSKKKSSDITILNENYNFEIDFLDIISTSNEDIFEYDFN